MSAVSRETRFRVEGMDCASCAKKIDTAVRRMDGIEDVRVSVMAGTMTTTDDGRADLETVAKTVTRLGYRTQLPTAVVGSDGTNSNQKPVEKDAHHDKCGHDHSGHDHLHNQEPVAPTTKNAGGRSALHGHDHRAPEGSWWSTAKAKLTIACGAAMAAAFIAGQVLPQTEPWGFIIAMLVGLIPIARRAFMGALNGSPFSIETLMTVAAMGALVIGATEEAAVVVLLFLIGELLEGIATSRARASITALADLMPRTALLEMNGETQAVPTDSLAVGNVIMVRPGDRVPADGEVISGESAVNEAPVTGESVPNRKETGDPVYAGTVNGEGVLRIKVTAASADNTIARVIALVEEAQESKAPTERFIDRFSKYYTPGVMMFAVLVAVIPPLAMDQDWATWIYRGLAVLLIGCPCALVISTPAAIAAGLSAGARRGLLMKGGAVLEGLRFIQQVAFDKTGTLTEGKPKVTNVFGTGLDEIEVLRLAGALEAGSSHPLALAILEYAQERKIRIGSAHNAASVGGKGVVGTFEDMDLFLGSPRAAGDRIPLPDVLKSQIAALNDEGKTVSVLLSNDTIAGIIAMRDEPRADAASGLRRLRQMGISAIMLTGDNQRTANAIAESLGIEARAELLPEDKQKIVGQLRQSGRYVAKVGDGINDAPALAAADIGIAMGGGTDVALETADAAVLHGRVSDVANMVDLSKATMRNIYVNIAIALGLKGVFLITTVLGITGLWPAILADTGATVLVTANAMRLLTWKGAGQ